MLSEHFRALGPYLYMIQLQTGFKQASCQLCQSEKVLRSLIQTDADSALTTGLFVPALSTKCLILFSKPGEFIKKVRVKTDIIQLVIEGPK